jgi:hypothetical protein
MAKDLSVDLRRRLVHDPLGTVGGGRGDRAPDKRGGNNRSHRIDEHGDMILSWTGEAPGLTLDEGRSCLAPRVGIAQERVMPVIWLA